MHAAGQDIQRPLAAVEASLQQVSSALRATDAAALELASATLRATLAAAIEPLRKGELSESARLRMMKAAAEVAAQREALARASAAVDRALEVLLPSQRVDYGADGAGQRVTNTGPMTA